MTVPSVVHGVASMIGGLVAAPFFVLSCKIIAYYNASVKSNYQFKVRFKLVIIYNSDRTKRCLPVVRYCNNCSRSVVNAIH